MKHEPCGLLSDAESACDFVGTDAVLAVRNHPHSGKPLVERHGRILKDGADLDGELPLSVDALALPLALIREEHEHPSATSRAFNAIGPAAADHELEAIIGIREVDDGLLECLWALFIVSHLNSEYPSPSDLSSILLPS